MVCMRHHLFGLHASSLWSALRQISLVRQVHLTYCEHLRRALDTAAAAGAGAGMMDEVAAAASSLRLAFEGAHAHLSGA